MPPVKRRAKGTKAPPNRWTRGEIDVLLKCLGSEEFLSKHAKTLQKRQFPTFSLRDACVKENEYHGVCVALSEEILNQAGEHNNLNLRPFASIASKILDMTAKAKASNPGLEAQELFDAFDVDAFMASSGPLGPEPPAADPAAASSTSKEAKGSAEGGEAAKEAEASKEDPKPNPNPDPSPSPSPNPNPNANANPNPNPNPNPSQASKEDEEYDDTYVAPVRREERGEPCWGR